MTTPSKFFPGRNADAVVDRFVDGILLFTATNSNPQGDPDTNEPRLTPDGLGLVTPQGIKSRVRKVIAGVFDHEMYISEHAVLEHKVSAATKHLTGKKINDEVRTDAKLSLAKKYFDVRCFGAVLTAPYNTRMTGPVQFSPAMSVHQVDLMHLKLTRQAVANEKLKSEGKDSTFGELPMVRFGLYSCHFTVAPHQAATTGCTWGDLDKIMFALQFMWSHTKSACRAGMAFERLDIFQHSHVGGSLPSERVLRSQKIVKKAGVEDPSSFDDFTVEVSPLPAIEHVKYTLDDIVPPGAPTAEWPQWRIGENGIAVAEAE